MDEKTIHYLSENPSRLADEIPFYSALPYTAIERVAPELAINVVSRLTDLDLIIVKKPVQDVQRFLDFLKNSGNIVELQFQGRQPQDLFDRLPDHCDVQKLTIGSSLTGFAFITRLKDLIHIDLNCPVNADLIRNLFKELTFLSWFDFKYNNKKKASIDRENPGKFCILRNGQWSEAPDLNAAIQLVFPKSLKRKAEAISQ